MILDKIKKLAWNVLENINLRSTNRMFYKQFDKTTHSSGGSSASGIFRFSGNIILFQNTSNTVIACV